MKLVAVICLLLLSACSVLSPSLMPIQGTLNKVSEKQRLCAERLFRDQAAGIENLRILLSGEIKSEGRELPLLVVVVGERKGNLRVEFIRPAINQLESILLVNQGMITGFSVSKQTVCQEGTNEENFTSILGLPLTAQELPLWVIGQFSLMQPADVQQSENGSGKFLLTVPLSNHRLLKILFSPDNPDLCQAKYLHVTDSEIETEHYKLYSSYKYSTANHWPDELSIIIKRIDWEAKFIVSEVSSNGDFSNKRDKLFSFVMPRNVRYESCSQLAIDPLSAVR